MRAGFYERLSYVWDMLQSHDSLTATDSTKGWPGRPISMIGIPFEGPGASRRDAGELELRDSVCTLPKVTLREAYVPGFRTGTRLKVDGRLARATYLTATKFMESANLRCPLCGDPNVGVYLSGDLRGAEGESEAFGSSRSSVAVSDLQRCGTCGFGFTQNRFTEEELSKIYGKLDERVYESEDHGRWITARRHLRIVHRYKIPPGRLLDVGCASGRFLSIAAQNGWKIAGVEPSEPFYRRARALLAEGAELAQCTLQEASLETAPFDVITMWDVLEHVPDPVGLLVLTRSLLKQEGRLFVNVPNLDSAIAKALGRRWPLLLPEHLNYFNRKSLRYCGEKAGFRTITFGRRPVSISLDYLFFRLGQHRFPLSLAIRRLLRDSWFAKCTVPVFYGECFAVMAQA